MAYIKTGNLRSRTRRGLMAEALVIGFAPLGYLSGARAADIMLPTVESLPAARAAAAARNNPLVVMVSLEGCPFCRAVRNSYLLPLRAEQGLDIVQVDMHSRQGIVAPDGSRTTHDALIRAWGVNIAPTLLFFGGGTGEAAPRLEGSGLPDFYGAYLDARIEQARATLKR